MDPAPIGTPLTIADLALRLAIATGIGLALGIDREIRRLPAGLRTHALVGLSAAATTLGALLLYQEVRADGGSADPLRIIQGLAQAIGFVAAGVIFVSGGDVRNLTSAANLWLTTAAGIAAGAGEYALAVLAAGFAIVVVSVVRLFERFVLDSKGDESG